MAESLVEIKTNDRAKKDENEQEQVCSPPEQPIKHPLEHTWCLWYNTNTASQEKWNENQLKIHSFSTVEDFWCLYHHLKPPSELNPGHDYAIFKSGIPPIWEHPANKQGGRWLLIMDKARKRTDEFWLNSIAMFRSQVLLMIGENFTHNSEMCGIVVTVRLKNKIEKRNVDIPKEHNFTVATSGHVRGPMGMMTGDMDKERLKPNSDLRNRQKNKRECDRAFYENVLPQT